jgi:hypothetical protein
MSILSSILSSIFKPLQSHSYQGFATNTLPAGSPKGLRNRGGNDCWLNSLMQMAATVPSLRDLVERLGFYAITIDSNSNVQKAGEELIEEFHTIINERAETTHVSRANTQKIRHLLQTILPEAQISDTGQEDAQAILASIISKVEEYQKQDGTYPNPQTYFFRAITTRLYEPLPISSEPKSSLRLSKEQKIQITLENPHDPEAYSTLNGDNCSRVTSDENFLHINLCEFEPILKDFQYRIPRMSAHEIEEHEKALFRLCMFNSFNESHTLKDAETADYFNPQDHKMHTFKLTDVTIRCNTAPREFIINTKRFNSDNTKLKHLMGSTAFGFPDRKEIRIPLQERFTISEEFIGERSTYEIDSFVVHMGETRGGHYISFQKVNDKWYRCDDSTVTEASALDFKHAFQESYFQHYKKLEHVDPTAIVVDSHIDRSLMSPSSSTFPTASSAQPNDHKKKTLSKQIQELESLQPSALHLHLIPQDMLNKLQEMVWLRDGMPSIWQYGESSIQNNPVTLFDPTGPLLYHEGSNLIEQLIHSKKHQLTLLSMEYDIDLLEYLKSICSSLPIRHHELHTLMHNLSFTTLQQFIFILANEYGKPFAAKTLAHRHEFGRDELHRDILVLKNLITNHDVLEKMQVGSIYLIGTNDTEKEKMKILIEKLKTSTIDKPLIERHFEELETSTQHALYGLVYHEHVATLAIKKAEDLLQNDIGIIARRHATTSPIDFVIMQLRHSIGTIKADTLQAHTRAIDEYQHFSDALKKEIKVRLK